MVYAGQGILGIWERGQVVIASLGLKDADRKTIIYDIQNIILMVYEY